MVQHRLHNSRALGAAAAASALFFVAACAGPQAPKDPLGRSVPQEVEEKLENTRDNLVSIVTEFARNYNQRACQLHGQDAQARQRRMALSAAYLNVAHALQDASDSVERETDAADATGAGPEEDSRGRIFWMKTETNGQSAGRSATAWSCLPEVSSDPFCTQAATSATARQLVRERLPTGYTAASVARAADLLAEELLWGLPILRSSPHPGQAWSTLRQRCQQGASPLAERLKNLEDDAEDADVLKAFKKRVKRGYPDVCDALPAMYHRLVGSLQARLHRTLPRASCEVEDWQILD